MKNFMNRVLGWIGCYGKKLGRVTATQAQAPATLQLERLETREALSANPVFSHTPLMSGDQKRQYLDGKGHLAYISMAAGEQAYTDWDLRQSFPDYHFRKYDVELYFSPDKQVTTADKLLFRDWLIAAPWHYFQLPSASDPIFASAETLENGSTVSTLFTSMRVIERDTGRDWWGKVDEDRVVVSRGPAKPAKPDIKMISLKADKEQVTVSYEIQGKLPKDEFFIRLAQSADTVYGSSDKALVNLRMINDRITPGVHTVSIPVGTKANQIKLPGAGLPDAPEGHYLVAMADPDKKIGESSGSNNTAFTKPDIKVSNVRFNGSTKTIAFQISDQISADDAFRDIQVKLYQSDSPIFDPKRAIARATLTVKATQTEGAFKLGQALKPQYGQFLHVVADPDKRFYDMGRKNNVALCAPDIDITRVEISSDLKKLTIDYTAWNVEGDSFELKVRQYRSATESTLLADRTAKVKGYRREFWLDGGAPIRANGTFLSLVASSKSDKNLKPKVTRVDLPFRKEEPETVKSRLFQIRIAGGVEFELLGAGVQFIDFEIQQMLPNGSWGPIRKMSYSGMGLGLSTPGSMGKSEWVAFETKLSLSIGQLQGLGGIGSAGNLGWDTTGFNTSLGLWFKGTGALLGTFVPFNAGGPSMGATLAQGTLGRWVLN